MKKPTALFALTALLITQVLLSPTDAVAQPAKKAKKEKAKIVRKQVAKYKNEQRPVFRVQKSLALNAQKDAKRDLKTKKRQLKELTKQENKAWTNRRDNIGRLRNKLNSAFADFENNKSQQNRQRLTQARYDFNWASSPNDPQAKNLRTLQTRLRQARTQVRTAQQSNNDADNAIEKIVSAKMQAKRRAMTVANQYQPLPGRQIMVARAQRPAPLAGQPPPLPAEPAGGPVQGPRVARGRGDLPAPPIPREPAGGAVRGGPEPLPGLPAPPLPPLSPQFRGVQAPPEPQKRGSSRVFVRHTNTLPDNANYHDFSPIPNPAGQLAYNFNSNIYNRVPHAGQDNVQQNAGGSAPPFGGVANLRGQSTKDRAAEMQRDGNRRPQESAANKNIYTRGPIIPANQRNQQQ